MMGLPTGSRVWLAAGVTDMRRGFDGLAALIQGALHEDRNGPVNTVLTLVRDYEIDV